MDTMSVPFYLLPVEWPEREGAELHDRHFHISQPSRQPAARIRTVLDQ